MNMKCNLISYLIPLSPLTSVKKFPLIQINILHINKISKKDIKILIVNSILPQMSKL